MLHAQPHAPSAVSLIDIQAGISWRAGMWPRCEPVASEIMLGLPYPSCLPGAYRTPAVCLGPTVPQLPAWGLQYPSCLPGAYNTPAACRCRCHLPSRGMRYTMSLFAPRSNQIQLIRLLRPQPQAQMRINRCHIPPLKDFE